LSEINLLPGGWSFALFAASDIKAEFDSRARSTYRLDMTDALLMLGILVVLASLLFFWAYYVRRRPREKNGVPIISTRETQEDQDGRKRVRMRRKRRRHHPDNFPRNPTLGETGGLPPLRPDEEPAPPEGGTSPPPQPKA
jgi:hypothetical protein